MVTASITCWIEGSMTSWVSRGRLDWPLEEGVSWFQPGKVFKVAWFGSSVEDDERLFIILGPS